jgi:hypothetical protein
LHFFAIPSDHATNQFRLLSDFLVHDVNQIISAHARVPEMPMGSFERVPGSQRIRWRGVPFIAPEVEMGGLGGNPLLTGGFFVNKLTNNPPPDELLSQFRNDTSLVLYDWEITGPIAYRMIQMSQVGRFLLGCARFSMTNNASLPWLVAASSKLENAGTSIRLVDSDHLSVSRISTIGFTAAELHLVTDWLVSPNFPQGFFSADAKPGNSATATTAPPVRGTQSN